MAFDLFGQSLADIPVGDIVFDKVGDNDQRNGEKRVGHFEGDEGTGGAVGDRKHRLLSSILCLWERFFLIWVDCLFLR